MSLGYFFRVFFLGVFAAFLQTAFLYSFAAPLAESLHQSLVVGGEEEVAEWAIPIAAAIYGGSYGTLYYLFLQRVEPLWGAFWLFLATALLPGLKWMPTPPGVSYVEPVWWREAVYFGYLLYNLAAVMLIALSKTRWHIAAGVFMLLAGFWATPGFILPARYEPYIPHLKALQGLSLASWGLFWLILGVGGRAFAPIKRP